MAAVCSSTSGGNPSNGECAANKRAISCMPHSIPGRHPTAKPRHRPANPPVRHGRGSCHEQDKPQQPAESRKRARNGVQPADDVGTELRPPAVGIPSAFPLPDARPHETGRNLQGRRGRWKLSTGRLCTGTLRGHDRPGLRLPPGLPSGRPASRARAARARTVRRPPPPDRDPSDDRRGTLIAPQTARC